MQIGEESTRGGGLYDEGSYYKVLLCNEGRRVEESARGGGKWDYVS
jgi:hypothetical protein